MKPVFGGFETGSNSLNSDSNGVTFDISNFDYVIQHNSNFEISKVYDIGLERYRDEKIKVFATKNQFLLLN